MVIRFNRFKCFTVNGGGTSLKVYNMERGTTVWGSTSGQTCDDGACPRSTQWTGKVALMYPSDYGFAVGGDIRSSCLTKNIHYYYSENDCLINNWLKPKKGSSWLLTSLSDISYRTYLIGYDGHLYTPGPNNIYFIQPVVYIKADAKITGGNGSVENPYTLG